MGMRVNGSYYGAACSVSRRNILKVIGRKVE